MNQYCFPVPLQPLYYYYIHCCWFHDIDHTLGLLMSMVWWSGKYCPSIHSTNCSWIKGEIVNWPCLFLISWILRCCRERKKNLNESFFFRSIPKQANIMVPKLILSRITLSPLLLYMNMCCFVQYVGIHLNDSPQFLFMQPVVNVVMAAHLICYTSPIHIHVALINNIRAQKFNHDTMASCCFMNLLLFFNPP
jgi:hypothetical protein